MYKNIIHLLGLVLLLSVASPAFCQDNYVVSNEVITVKGVRFTMVFVEGGTFEMGNDSHQRERPKHTVTVDDFYIGETEVTQELWMAVMGGKNPSKHIGPIIPVTKISYYDVQQFLEKLRTLTNRSFRLPTEAEWEFAARGGNKSRGTKYSGHRTLGLVGWYRDNGDQRAHPVMSKRPNELGIYDMSGNVWEWVQDWYDKNYYQNSPQDNPQGPETGIDKVIRGGGWGVNSDYCRLTYRTYLEPDNNVTLNVGFRIVLVP